jgi:histidinol-phosphatase (PHP family)
MYSLHTHTLWSDGIADIADMVNAAAVNGLSEYGISDHYTLMPDNNTVPWSMPLSQLPEYVHAVLENARHSPIPLRLGIEADYFPETMDIIRQNLAPFSFDYIIGSVHFLNDFPVDEAASCWEQLSPEQQENLWSLYWKRIQQMAQTHFFDIAAHLDLPKKFGCVPAKDHTAEENLALDAIAEAHMAVEINTAGWHMPVNEAYPSLALLKKCRERDIPILISSDAHLPSTVSRDFPRALKLARDAGYPSLVRYEQHHQHTVPI